MAVEGVIANAVEDLLARIDAIYIRHGKRFDRTAFLAQSLMMEADEVPEDLGRLTVGQLSQAARDVETRLAAASAHDEAASQKRVTGKEAAAGME